MGDGCTDRYKVSSNQVLTTSRRNLLGKSRHSAVGAFSEWLNAVVNALFDDTILSAGFCYFLEAFWRGLCPAWTSNRNLSGCLQLDSLFEFCWVF